MIQNKNLKPQTERFRPEQHIREEWIFKFLFDKGKFARGKHFHLWVYLDKEEKFPGIGPKLGLVVGRKTSHRANIRNLWKRRMREVFRKSQRQIKSEAVILLQARSANRTPTFQEMKTEIETLLEKVGARE